MFPHARIQALLPHLSMPETSYYGNVASELLHTHDASLRCSPSPLAKLPDGGFNEAISPYRGQRLFTIS